MKILEGKRPLILALTLAAAFKLWLVLSNAVTFNGDEAVIATMARHILQGARPVFFYGQQYMGSLDAYLVAGGFAIFGEHVWVIWLVQTLLYLLYIATLWWLARMWFKDPLKPAIIVFLTIIPPIVITTYTTMSLGGYGESLVLGNLILGLGYLVTFGDKQFKAWAWIALGLVGGLAFWTLGISGIYLLTVGLIGLWKFDLKKIKFYLLAGVSFILGSLPWWLYNLANNWSAWRALSGSHIYSSTMIERIQSALLFGFPALLSMRYPWRPEYLPWPLLFITLCLYLVVGIYILDRIRKKDLFGKLGGRTVIIVFTISFFLLLVTSRFGIDITGRYLLPLYLPLLFATASLIIKVFNKRPIFGWLLVLAFLGINAAGSLLVANSPDKFTTQFDPISSFDNSYDEALIEFLSEHNELRGYSNYWVTFRLAFLSNEEIIYAADLPNKEDLSYNPVDNRYLPYSDLADASEKVAYITTKHPLLDEKLREAFDLLNIDYVETQIGAYHIFYQLSEPVRPEDIGFGQPSP